MSDVFRLCRRRPCAQCPFRTTAAYAPGEARVLPARLIEDARSGEHSCHLSRRLTGQRRYDREHACAGGLIFMRNSGIAADRAVMAQMQDVDMSVAATIFASEPDLLAHEFIRVPRHV